MVNLSKSVICIDIGNTTSHIGVYKNGILVKENRIKSSSLMNNPKKNLYDYDFSSFPLSYCSVYPMAEDSLLRFIRNKKINAFNLNNKTKGNFPINYPNPREIGQDRLANSFAVYYTSELPCIVVDVGTATTFDIVTQNGGYEGGVIAPGPQGFLDFLNQNTALLPEVNLNEFITGSSIGKETKQAMLIGANVGHISMKKGIISTLSKEIEKIFLKKPQLILTGGACISSNFPEIKYIPDLTIYGLALAYQLNASKSATDI